MDLEKIRAEFPILNEKIHDNKNLIYLDNGATVQKPRSVLNRMSDYYCKENANIHRGVHYLSDLSTNNYELSRQKLKTLINAKYDHEIIFTSGTTSSINLISSTIGEVSNPDRNELLITAMEHHSNIVPWQILAERKGLKLKVLPMNNKGELLLDNIDSFISERTLIFSFTYISNSLGTINPVKLLLKKAKDNGALTFVDAAQAVQHKPIDVQDLDCDFLAFSGHKMYGPTGVGVLYGKESELNILPPYQGGGDMIESVSFEKTIYNKLPFKFEAGTPNISGAIVLGEAVDFLLDIGLENIYNHEANILDYATNKLKNIDGLKLIGQAEDKSSVISFIVDGIHSFDLGTILDNYGIAVRTGHHCTQPVMDFFKISGTTRASIAMYNTKNEIDIFYEKLMLAIKMLR